MEQSLKIQLHKNLPLLTIILKGRIYISLISLCSRTLHFPTVKTTFSYRGQFRVPDLDFNVKWGDSSTSEYATLAAEVKTKVSGTNIFNLYQQITQGILVNRDDKHDPEEQTRKLAFQYCS